MNAKVDAEKSAVAQAVKVVANKPLPKSTGTKVATKPSSAKPVSVKSAAKSAAKDAKDVKELKDSKPRKVKLVRASYTLPDTECAALLDLKSRITKLGTASKKSELLRAGIALLAKLDDAALKLAIAEVEVIKTGRKAKAK